MDSKTYAAFNTLTIEGRISHDEIAKGQYGEFLAVTLLTELKNDAPAIAVQFNSTNGLMTLYKKGLLNNGRRLTVTGHLDSFTELYFDKKSGKTKRLQRPRLQLSNAVVFAGGLGPAKKQEEVFDDELEIDETPALPEKKKYGEPVAANASGEIDF